MTDTATATHITSQQSEADPTQVVEAKFPDGRIIQVIIPPPLCVKVTEATQSFLMRSMAIAQKMGGRALLDVSKVSLEHRGNDQNLVLETDHLKAIEFRLTPAQWRTLLNLMEAHKPHDKRKIQ